MIVVAMAAASLLALAAVAPVLAPDGAVAHNLFGDARVPDAGNSSAVTGNENGDYEGPREEYREEMLEMLRDHMGLEGAQAEEWADTMLAGCTGGDYGTSDRAGYGYGMMGGGYGSGSGGMMGW